jgi:hypothetical protein
MVELWTPGPEQAVIGADLLGNRLTVPEQS